MFVVFGEKMRTVTLDLPSLKGKWKVGNIILSVFGDPQEKEIRNVVCA